MERREAIRKITIKRGDITKETVDAIVNAANSSLLGGGGVDGAIHRAAGPELLTECASLGGCPAGRAKTTKGYRLPAKFVIHTVGPIWRGGKAGEEQTLADAYTNSLKEALRIGAKTVAFPAISTGVYHFPPERAAQIAVETVADFLAQHNEIDEVRLVCFSEESEQWHRKALEEKARA
ncbi:O-acetyl-ADP-ribose deacetylase [Synergistaceae bacterium OttesenSCG-928-D05]|nr:O-acetyl-ADP-ribose deacetylase [Synergistaceae bacterium OttesenSCG-928-D05]